MSLIIWNAIGLFLLIAIFYLSFGALFERDVTYDWLFF